MGATNDVLANSNKSPTEDLKVVSDYGRFLGSLFGLTFRVPIQGGGGVCSTVVLAIGIRQQFEDVSNFNTHLVYDGDDEYANVHLSDRQLCRRLISRVRVTSTRHTNSIISDDRHTKITPENVSRMWNIGLDAAKKVLEVTTPTGVRTALHPLQRRYLADNLHLNRLRLRTTFYTDALFSKVKSINGMTCAQVFTDGKSPFVYPMPTKKDVGKALTDFMDDAGIPIVRYTMVQGRWQVATPTSRGRFVD